MASECIAGELDCRLFELYDEYGLALRIGLLCLGVQLACTLGVLYWILGPAALGGLGVTLVTLPLNAVVMRLIKVREESTPRRAARSLARNRLP